VERETLTDEEMRTDVREGSTWVKDEVEDTDSSDAGDDSDGTDMDGDDTDPDADTTDAG
jgi:hypothetical protein